MKVEDAILAYNKINGYKANTTVATSDFSDAYSKALNGNTAGSNGLQTTSYEDIFQKASKAYGVPVNLLKAVAKAESGFNAKAVSSSGAQGVMQLMPKTATALGVSDPLNPEQNIMGGAKYLSQMLKNYNGDTTLALAAYNAGSGNVKKYGGVPPFKETKNYIAKVLNYAGENIDASHFKTNASTNFNTNANSLVANYVNLTQNSEQLLNNLSSEGSTEEDFMASLVLLKIIELQSKASSIGKLSEEEEA